MLLKTFPAQTYILEFGAAAFSKLLGVPPGCRSLLTAKARSQRTFQFASFPFLVRCPLAQQFHY